MGQCVGGSLSQALVERLPSASFSMWSECLEPAFGAGRVLKPTRLIVAAKQAKFAEIGAGEVEERAGDAVFDDRQVVAVRQRGGDRDTGQR